jgi:hypothetical protein
MHTTLWDHALPVDEKFAAAIFSFAASVGPMAQSVVTCSKNSHRTHKRKHGRLTSQMSRMSQIPRAVRLMAYVLGHSIVTIAILLAIFFVEWLVNSLSGPNKNLYDLIPIKYIFDV